MPISIPIYKELKFKSAKYFLLPDPVRVRFTDRLLRPTFLKGQKQNKKHSRVPNVKSHITRLQSLASAVGTDGRERKNKNLSRVSNVKSPIYFSFIF